MHISLLDTFYFIRKFFYLEQIVPFSLIFLKFMASPILDSNRAKLPVWNCKSQDSRTGYMSFWLCISWQFSYGILGLKRSDRSYAKLISEFGCLIQWTRWTQKRVFINSFDSNSSICSGNFYPYVEHPHFRATAFSRYFLYIFLLL